MTKEQAIKLLRKDTNADEMYSLTKYGLRSAEIQELLQEAMDMGAEAIKNQTWISVDDMLPENAERYKGRKVIDVLVTTEKGLVTKVQRQCYRDSWSWGRIFSRVVAWMPLPKAYKGKVSK